MKKPLLFGFAALCVLSTPNLLEEKSHTKVDSTYRTIASQELRPENRPEKPSKRPPRGEDRVPKKSRPTQETPPIEKESSSEEKVVIDTKEKKEEKKENNETESKEEVVEKTPVIEEDVSVCEFRNEIDELRKQIGDLLNDKEEVLAKVDKKDKKKNKNKDEDKDSEKSDKDKEEKVAKVPSRYQQILSIGMIFGQGFQSSFQMPMMRFGTNPFMNSNPMFQFNNKRSFGFTQDNSWMSPGVLEMMNVGQPKRGMSQSLRMNTETFIPTFTRTSIKAEGININ